MFTRGTLLHVKWIRQAHLLTYLPSTRTKPELGHPLLTKQAFEEAKAKGYTILTASHPEKSVAASQFAFPPTDALAAKFCDLYERLTEGDHGTALAELPPTAPDIFAKFPHFVCQTTCHAVRVLRSDGTVRTHLVSPWRDYLHEALLPLLSDQPIHVSKVIEALSSAEYFVSVGFIIAFAQRFPMDVKVNKRTYMLSLHSLKLAKDLLPVEGTPFPLSHRSLEDSQKELPDDRRLLAMSRPESSVATAVYMFPCVAGTGVVAFYDVYPLIPESEDGISLRALALDCSSTVPHLHDLLAKHPHFVRLTDTHAIRVLRPDGTVREGPSPWREILTEIMAAATPVPQRVPELASKLGWDEKKTVGRIASIAKRFPFELRVDTIANTIQLYLEHEEGLGVSELGSPFRMPKGLIQPPSIPSHLRIIQISNPARSLSTAYYAFREVKNESVPFYNLYPLIPDTNEGIELSQLPEGSARVLRQFPHFVHVSLRHAHRVLRKDGTVRVGPSPWWDLLSEILKVVPPGSPRLPFWKVEKALGWGSDITNVYGDLVGVARRFPATLDVDWKHTRTLCRIEDAVHTLGSPFRLSREVLYESQIKLPPNLRLVPMSDPSHSVTTHTFVFKTVSGLGFYDVYPMVPRDTAISLEALAKLCPGADVLNVDTIRGVLGQFPHFVRLTDTHAMRVLRPDGTVREGPSPWMDILSQIVSHLKSDGIGVHLSTLQEAMKWDFARYGSLASIVRRFPWALTLDPSDLIVCRATAAMSPGQVSIDDGATPFYVQKSRVVAKPHLCVVEISSPSRSLTVQYFSVRLTQGIGLADLYPLMPQDGTGLGVDELVKKIPDASVEALTNIALQYPRFVHMDKYSKLQRVVRMDGTIRMDVESPWKTILHRMTEALGDGSPEGGLDVWTLEDKLDWTRHYRKSYGSAVSVIKRFPQYLTLSRNNKVCLVQQPHELGTPYPASEDDPTSVPPRTRLVAITAPRRSVSHAFWLFREENDKDKLAFYEVYPRIPDDDQGINLSKLPPNSLEVLKKFPHFVSLIQNDTYAVRVLRSNGTVRDGPNPWWTILSKILPLVDTVTPTKLSAVATALKLSTEWSETETRRVYGPLKGIVKRFPLHLIVDKKSRTVRKTELLLGPSVEEPLASSSLVPRRTTMPHLGVPFYTLPGTQDSIPPKFRLLRMCTGEQPVSVPNFLFPEVEKGELAFYDVYPRIPEDEHGIDIEDLPEGSVELLRQFPHFVRLTPTSAIRVLRSDGTVRPGAHPWKVIFNEIRTHVSAGPVEFLELEQRLRWREWIQGSFGSLRSVAHRFPQELCVDEAHGVLRLRDSAESLPSESGSPFYESQPVPAGVRILRISNPGVDVATPFYAFRVVEGVGFYDVYPHIPMTDNGITLLELTAKVQKGAKVDEVHDVLLKFPHFVKITKDFLRPSVIHVTRLSRRSRKEGRTETARV